MKRILVNAMILIYTPSVLGAQSLSKDEACIYNSEYIEKIQIRDNSLENVENLFIDVSSLENNNFEVKLSVNKYFKPFVIMGAKVSEFLSDFNLNNLSKGVGANIHMNESFSYYAKYSSSTLEDERLINIDSSVMSLGVEYNF